MNQQTTSINNTIARLLSGTFNEADEDSLIEWIGDNPDRLDELLAVARSVNARHLCAEAEIGDGQTPAVQNPTDRQPTKAVATTNFSIAPTESDSKWGKYLKAKQKHGGHLDHEEKTTYRNAAEDHEKKPSEKKSQDTNNSGSSVPIWWTIIGFVLMVAFFFYRISTQTSNDSKVNFNPIRPVEERQAIDKIIKEKNIKLNFNTDTGSCADTSRRGRFSSKQRQKLNSPTEHESE